MATNMNPTRLRDSFRPPPADRLKDPAFGKRCLKGLSERYQKPPRKDKGSSRQLFEQRAQVFARALLAEAPAN